MRRTETSYPGIDDRIVREARDFFKLSSAAEDDNRQRGLRAQKFRIGGKNQWDEDVLNLRDGRPCESYNQIPQFVHQVTNDQRMNMPQTRFVAGNDGTKEVAETYEDLARNIQTTSEAEVAYDNAVDSQVTIGWGYWRYITEYENDKTFDQIIKIQWVQNTFTVYDDPFAMQQDKLDRKRLLQVCDMSWDDYKAEYGDEDLNWNELQSIGDDAPNWGSEDTIRIAEFWKVTEEKKTLYRTKKGKITETRPKGEIKDEDKREVSVPKVMWYKINAKRVLDSKEWPGIYIPYVRITGECLIEDGQERLSGIVEGMMAPQKQINYWTNAATEQVALAPISPFLVDAQAIGPYQAVWDQLNVRATPYLPYISSVGNKQLPPPTRLSSGADISGMMAMIQTAQQGFYNTTGIYPASLGQASNEKSGKAILARQREGDTSTFHYGDNTARGQRAGGRIMADLFPKIYDGARSVTLTSEDKKVRKVQINEPFTDEETGERRILDLTVGTYDVLVTTGPSVTSKRAEGAEAQMQLVQAYPPLMQIAGPQIVRNQDWPGADAIADALERAQPPELREQPKGALPAQIQQAMQAMQQQLQQAGQALQTVQQHGQELEAKSAQEIQALKQQLADKSAEYQLKDRELGLRELEIGLKHEEAVMKNTADVEKAKMAGIVDLEVAHIGNEQATMDAAVRQYEIDNTQNLTSEDEMA